MANPLLLLPDFLLILLGFVTRHVTGLDRPVWEAAERLVYFLLFPVLRFNSIVKSPLQPVQTLSLALAGVGTVAIGVVVALAIGRWPVSTGACMPRGRTSPIASTPASHSPWPNECKARKDWPGWRS
jgi:hypothetical protein